VLTFINVFDVSQAHYALRRILHDLYCRPSRTVLIDKLSLRMDIVVAFEIAKHPSRLAFPDFAIDPIRTLRLAAVRRERAHGRVGN